MYLQWPAYMHRHAHLAEVLVPLQQEHVLSTVTAVDGQAPRPLFAGDHRQLWRKGGNGHDWLAYQVRAWDRQFQALQKTNWSVLSG